MQNFLLVIKMWCSNSQICSDKALNIPVFQYECLLFSILPCWACRSFTHWLFFLPLCLNTETKSEIQTHQYSDSNRCQSRRHSSLFVQSLYSEGVRVRWVIQGFIVQNLENWQLPCHWVNVEKLQYLRIQAFSSDLICEIRAKVGVRCLKKNKQKNKQIKLPVFCMLRCCNHLFYDGQQQIHILVMPVVANFNVQLVANALLFFSKHLNGSLEGNLPFSILHPSTTHRVVWTFMTPPIAAWNVK